jgi:oligosaccharide repeat unit polymerase
MRNHSNIWWLNPAALFGIAGAVIAVCAYAISEATYRTYWRTPKFFDLSALWISLGCCAVFAFGSALSTWFLSRTARLEQEPDWMETIPWNTMHTLFRLSFYLCVLGYLVWVILAVQRGMTLQIVGEVLLGEKGAMYDARFTYLPTVGGVTTLTQFGTASVILGAVIAFFHGWKSVRFKLGVLVLLALLRALINSERFALIELFVPFLIVGLGVRVLNRPAPRRRRVLMNLAPAIGVVSLLLFFTGFEYLRSWSNYYSGRDQSLLEFGSMRLLGYYVTSFNNGAYLLQRLDPLNAPYFTAHFLWTFPLSSSAIKHFFPDPMLDTADKWFYFPFLESEANVEFNNADGMLFPLMDYGVAGGLIYWTVAGLACGWLYHQFRSRRPSGMLLYPLIYLALLEVPLTLYWGEGRAVYSLTLLTGACCWFWWRRRYAPAEQLPAGEFSYEVS